MERKRFIKEVYATYWITAREKIHGFSKYDKNLCNYICEHVPNGGKLLEVAIGTGYPFGDFLQKTGYIMYGIDISLNLIEKCKRLYPNINCNVGDAENLEHPDNFFDATYCFASTWYFPDLNKAIDEMIRVTRPNGLIIFDIQNCNNPDIDRLHRRNLAKMRGMNRIKEYIKNIGKAILRRGVPNWHFIVYECPTGPESIYEHLSERRISDFQVMVRNEDDSLEVRNKLGPFEDFGRLVFVIKVNPQMVIGR